MGKRRRQVMFIRRDIQTLTTAHILATFQAGRPTAFGFFSWAGVGEHRSELRFWTKVIVVLTRNVEHQYIQLVFGPAI